MSARAKLYFIILALFLTFASLASPQDATQPRFRALYQELVETNTTLSAGDCTLAAQKMAAHLKAAGYPDADLQIFVPDGHPKEGGLIAVDLTESFGGQYDGTLDGIAQLADIAGPVVSGQRLLGLRREPGNHLAALGGKIFQELERQRQNVLAPLAQGRQ